jgi:hypothetical protein
MQLLLIPEFICDAGDAGTPSPLWGYFGRKLFMISSLRDDTVCKILITDGLRAKYCKQTSYGINSSLRAE